MGRGRNNLRTPDSIERVPFKLFSFGSSAGGSTVAAPTITSANMSPAFELRLAQIAEAFQYYRFSKITVSLFPCKTATNDSAVSVGYIPRTPNTAPATHYEVCTLPASAHKSHSQTVPARMMVSKNVLLGDAPLKWYQTVVGTEDTQWEIQGVVYFASNVVSAAVANNFYFIIEGICEFKGRSALTQTPLYKQPSLCATDQESSFPEIKVGNVVYKVATA